MDTHCWVFSIKKVVLVVTKRLREKERIVGWGWTFLQPLSSYHRCVGRAYRLHWNTSFTIYNDTGEKSARTPTSALYRCCNLCHRLIANNNSRAKRRHLSRTDIATLDVSNQRSIHVNAEVARPPSRPNLSISCGNRSAPGLETGFVVSQKAAEKK